MDDRRFDNLARAVAGGASRRQMVKGLGGGIAALLGLGRFARLGAQELVPLGGQCSAFGANAECSQAGTPTGGVAVICSDNGVARDGSFNCCRNAGGVCSADFHCCGAALCTNGLCGGGGVSQLPLGSQCTATSQCGQEGGSVVCSDNGLLRDGSLNCCRNAGGACAVDASCCGALLCAGGVCGGAPSGNLSLGAVCTANSECSQAGGAVVCADNGLASDGAFNCCRNQGGACANGASCCASLNCVGGVCTPASPGNNLALGAVCTAGTQCDQTGGPVVCADNGIATDGALNCCRNEGGACTGLNNSADCCGGLYCVNGVCGARSTGTTLALGATCTASSQCDQTGGTVVCADNGITTDGALNCCRNAGGACTAANNSASCCGGLHCLNGTCQ